MFLFARISHHLILILTTHHTPCYALVSGTLIKRESHSYSIKNALENLVCVKINTNWNKMNFLSQFFRKKRNHAYEPSVNHAYDKIYFYRLPIPLAQQRQYFARRKWFPLMGLQRGLQASLSTGILQKILLIVVGLKLF